MASGNHGGPRLGAGRPPELGESKLISFDCPLDLLDKLTKEAKIRGLSRADYIRDLLKKGLKMDWDQFGFNLSDEEAADVEREAEMRKLRGDYRWIKDCEGKSIEALKEIAGGSEQDYDNPANLRRHRLAQIVLEYRERKEQ